MAPTRSPPRDLRQRDELKCRNGHGNRHIENARHAVERVRSRSGAGFVSGASCGCEVETNTVRVRHDGHADERRAESPGDIARQDWIAGLVLHPDFHWFGAAGSENDRSNGCGHVESPKMVQACEVQAADAVTPKAPMVISGHKFHCSYDEPAGNLLQGTEITYDMGKARVNVTSEGG